MYPVVSLRIPPLRTPPWKPLPKAMENFFTKGHTDIFVLRNVKNIIPFFQWDSSVEISYIQNIEYHSIQFLSSASTFSVSSWFWGFVFSFIFLHVVENNGGCVFKKEKRRKLKKFPKNTKSDPNSKLKSNVNSWDEFLNAGWSLSIRHFIWLFFKLWHITYIGIYSLTTLYVLNFTVS